MWENSFKTLGMFKIIVNDGYNTTYSIPLGVET